MNVLRWIDQSSFLAFGIGLLLSAFFSVKKVSLLQMAETSHAMIFELRPLRQLFSRYQRIIFHIVTVLISLMIGAVIYYLLYFSASINLNLNLLLQIFFVMQVYSLKDHFLHLMTARRTILEKGTLIGLRQIESPIYREVKEVNPACKYEEILKCYLQQIVIFWTIPVLIYYFLSLPYVFAYVAFMMQLEIGEENSIAYHILLFLPYNIVMTIMRLLLHILPYDKEKIKLFGEKYLGYSKLLPHQVSEAKVEVEEIKKEDSTIELEEISILFSLITLFLSLLFISVLCLLYFQVEKG